MPTNYVLYNTTRKGNGSKLNEWGSRGRIKSSFTLTKKLFSLWIDDLFSHILQKKS